MPITLDTYIEYERRMQRERIFELIAAKYSIQSAVYPGSYLHIAPSLYIQEVVYIDTDKKAKKFFASVDYLKYINKNKVYDNEAQMEFYGQDYSKIIPKYEEYFDLMISQYAGPISQECKPYLKESGILLVNNSHGDAQLAYADPDYSFIGIVNYRNKKFRFSEKDLEKYFIPKKDSISLVLSDLKTRNKGIGFTKSASHYLFKRG